MLRITQIGPLTNPPKSPAHGGEEAVLFRDCGLMFFHNHNCQEGDYQAIRWLYIACTRSQFPVELERLDASRYIVPWAGRRRSARGSAASVSVHISLQARLVRSSYRDRAPPARRG